MNVNGPFTWDDLQFFLAVARSGQLSTAARQLRTSHATVSRRIDRLEFALKAKLFERHARGYVLTGIGLRLVESADRIEQETERLQAEVTGGATFHSGVVRINAPEGFSNFFLAHVLPQFAARHPHLSLELVTIQQIMSLSRKDADITVALDEPKGGPYIAQKLTDYQLQIYGSADYLSRSPPIACREDLLDHPFIGYIEEMIFSPGLDYLGDVHPKIRPRFQSSSIFAQLSATRNGLGLCVLPYFITSRFPELQVVLPQEVDLRREYWMASHRDLRQTPRLRAVADFLVETVSSPLALFVPRPKRLDGE